MTFFPLGCHRSWGQATLPTAGPPLGSTAPPSLYPVSLTPGPGPISGTSLPKSSALTNGLGFSLAVSPATSLKGVVKNDSLAPLTKHLQCAGPIPDAGAVMTGMPEDQLHLRKFTGNWGLVGATSSVSFHSSGLPSAIASPFLEVTAHAPAS